MHNVIGLLRTRIWQTALGALAGFMVVGADGTARASDHLDTPTVIANPQADIGDLYAWTAPSGHQLNLVMTIVGHDFSDRIEYAFHIDSGSQFGKTTATTAIRCRFPAADTANCKVGDVDSAYGNARNPDGLQGRNRRFRVFAGLRDDPFFNNVRGTRAAYQTAATALHNGAVVDAQGCPGSDGVDHDEREHSATVFPFLAPPAATSATRQ